MIREEQIKAVVKIADRFSLTGQLPEGFIPSIVDAIGLDELQIRRVMLKKHISVIASIYAKALSQSKDIIKIKGVSQDND